MKWNQRASDLLRRGTSALINHPAFPRTVQRRLKEVVRRRRRTEGTPTGVPPGILADMCIRLWEIAPRSFHHLPIESWKGSSASFVWVDLAGAGVKRLIVKTAADHDVVRLDTEFPVASGPPEWWVYNEAARTLAKHLPACLLAMRLDEPDRILYVLEDLTATHLHPPETGDWRTGTVHMEDLHASLELAAKIDGSDLLPTYDKDFSAELVTRSVKSLERLHQLTRSQAVQTALGDWSRIERSYLSNEFDLPELRRCVHGDYNIGNIFISKRDHSAAKVIDWEWSGFGYPHIDLASYLRGAPPEIVEDLLVEFAYSHPELPESAHKRLFSRSVLERCIWDALLFSNEVARRNDRYARLESAIENSLVGAFSALENLSD